MKLLPQFFLIAAVLLSMSFASAQGDTKSQFSKVMSLYSQGKYQSTVDELYTLQEKFKKDKKVLGLIYYWNGLSFNRLQNFPMAIANFKLARQSGYDTVDIAYEYGQALFAADKLVDSRIQFNESFKNGFKRGASLYYMAFISKELGETDNARTLYNAVKKLPPEESADSAQAAEMQLADIRLEEAEKETSVFRAIETEVIPLYQNALAINPESPLAPRIKEKVTSLQKKYELVLFQLRNGRPTAIPAHYLRIAQEIGNDSNVTFMPTETTISKSKQSSPFSKTEVMGRYTFYYKNFISIAPELRFNYSRYYNREPEIFRNDNYLVAPAIRTTYEHSLFEKPASVLLDYDFNQAERDVYAKKDLEFSSRSHSLSAGERFTFFTAGQSTVRLRYRKFDSYLEASDSNTTSLILEQVVSLKNSTLLFYSSLDKTKVNDEVFDTNAFNLRTDWLLPQFRDWFTPSVGLGLTLTDPVNDRKDRGLEKMINPNTRLSRRFGKNWGGNFRLEHQKNYSKDEASFAFKKTLYAFEVDYLF